MWNKDDEVVVENAFPETPSSGHGQSFDWDRAVMLWRQGRAKRSPMSPEEIREQVAKEIEALIAIRMRFRKKHLKELIGILLWKYTEADGKYQTRYISRQAYDMVRQAGEGFQTGKNLRHEHVWERDLVIETLLAWPQATKRILQSVVSCTVTLEESLALNLATHVVESGDRWARYRYAGIEVIDLAAQSHASRVACEIP